MAYTSDDLDAVRRAMRGDKAVQYENRLVTRRSMDELKQLEQDILRELSAATGATRRRKQALGVASKGF